MDSYTKNTKMFSPPGVIIFNSPAKSHKFVGSPCIVKLHDNTYIASHDVFGNTISNTYIYKTINKGKNWDKIAVIEKLNWSTLFLINKELYILGVRPKNVEGFGDCVIHKSIDGGYTWTFPSDDKHGILCEGDFHSAPTSILFHQGIIWKGMEEKNKDNTPYSAFVISAKDNTNLLDSKNWIISNKLIYNTNYLKNSLTWLEGNIIIDRNNKIKNILRIKNPEDDIAAIIDVDPDRKYISFKVDSGLIKLPGAGKKFTLRYDNFSNKYWTLSNYVPNKIETVNNEYMRNTIALVCSDNLLDWQIRSILLHHPNHKKYGFQYIDWFIDGDDIAAVSRTAWEDETGEACNQHDANYFLFHRFLNFREKL